MVLIGLHITKCAGTTLANHIKARLPPNSWYLCSTFREFHLMGRLELMERTDLDSLRFVFGHYVHESLFSIVPDTPIFLFTGVREPVGRAVSDYFQVCKVRAKAGLPPLEVTEYLAAKSNSMCKEIIRAFPTLAKEAGGSLSNQAGQICKMFDMIYDMETFSDAADILLELLNIRFDAGSRSMHQANVGDSADLEYAATAEAIVRERGADFFGEDCKLFESLKPRISKVCLTGTGGASEIDDYRVRWERILRSNAEGRSVFSQHLAKHFVAQYRNTNRLTELTELITKKEDWLRALRHFAKSGAQ